MQTEGDEIHVITRNRKARHEYEIVDTFEAGIELRGSEVKVDSGRESQPERSICRCPKRAGDLAEYAY